MNRLGTVNGQITPVGYTHTPPWIEHENIFITAEDRRGAAANRDARHAPLRDLSSPGIYRGSESRTHLVPYPEYEPAQLNYRLPCR